LQRAALVVVQLGHLQSSVAGRRNKPGAAGCRAL
jgi:hypothetical protein